MLCPYCSNPETRVTNKRDTGGMTKRRRECMKCKRRFNTQEAVEQWALRVIKKDAQREDFDREKLHRGILRACEKRPVTSETINKMITTIEEKLRKKGNEVTSTLIGEYVTKELKKIDQIAYIRFASVYREFGDIADVKNPPLKWRACWRVLEHAQGLRLLAHELKWGDCANVILDVSSAKLRNW